MPASSSDFHNSALVLLGVAFVLLILTVTILTILGVLKLSALKEELRAIRKASPARKNALDPNAKLGECLQKIDQFSLELAELRGQIQIHEQSLQTNSPVWASETIPIQLNRRGQILKLADKGKSITEIASDLGVARGEVELLLKVHDLQRAAPGAEDVPVRL